jgi:hypothetical protein
MSGGVIERHRCRFTQKKIFPAENLFLTSRGEDE